VFRSFHESGIGKTRHYVHDDEAALYGCAPGTFTDWEALPEHSDLLFYEGLHGAVKADRVNISQYPDLKIGVVPVINLEWIQKIHRDCSARGYSTEAVMDTMLRRMPDYVHYICPQFTETDINFQRVPTVDTSKRSYSLHPLSSVTRYSLAIRSMVLITTAGDLRQSML
jgi:phosphoribulokinase